MVREIWRCIISHTLVKTIQQLTSQVNGSLKLHCFRLWGNLRNSTADTNRERILDKYTSSSKCLSLDYENLKITLNTLATEIKEEPLNKIRQLTGEKFNQLKVFFSEEKGIHTNGIEEAKEHTNKS